VTAAAGTEQGQDGRTASRSQIALDPNHRERTDIRETVLLSFQAVSVHVQKRTKPRTKRPKPLVILAGDDDLWLSG